MEMELENGNSTNSAHTFKSHTSVPNRRSTRRKKNLSELQRRSFASVKTLKSRLAPVRHRNIRKLLEARMRIKGYLKKFRESKQGSDRETVYSFLLSSLGEIVEEDLKEYFLNSPKNTFKQKVAKHLKEVGLFIFDIDDFEDYAFEITEFIEWLVGLSNSDPSMAEDVDEYSQRLLKIFHDVFVKSKKEFKHSPEMNNLLSAFSKVRM